MQGPTGSFFSGGFGWGIDEKRGLLADSGWVEVLKYSISHFQVPYLLSSISWYVGYLRVFWVFIYILCLPEMLGLLGDFQN